MHHLYIRADATTQIGAGHVMRCLAIAQAWQSWGGRVTFISHCENRPLKQKIQSGGFGMVSVNTACPDPSDLKQTLDTIHSSNENQDACSQGAWIILDGYHFTPEYQKALLENQYHVLVIDDNHHLPQYHATLILNQNLSANQLHYSCDTNTQSLLGARYALIRREFLDRPKPGQRHPGNHCNLLVTMGGSDADNGTLKVIQSLKELNHPKLKTKIVIGPSNPNTPMLKDLDLKAEDITLIEDGNMPELMDWADMAVTAGGSTCLELAYMGVPFIALITADNQIEPVTALESQDAAINLGPIQGLNTTTLTQALTSLLFDTKRREQLSSKAQNLIDGKGAKRVIREMIAGPVSMRSATREDANRIWDLANDPLVREASFTKAVIPWEIHLHWFKNKLSDPNTFLFIAENRSHHFMGQIRFEKKENSFWVSYSMTAAFRGMGLGTMFLETGIHHLQQVLDGHIQIKGEVKANNIASKKSFERCGFTLISHNRSKRIYQFKLAPRDDLS